MTDDVFFRDLHAFPSDDNGLDGFTEYVVGNAEYGDLAHFGQFGDDPLNFDRADFFAPAFDDVVFAGYEIQVSVFVRGEQIAVYSVRSHGYRPGRSTRADSSGRPQ